MPLGTDALGWLRCLARYYGLDSGAINMSTNERLARADGLQTPDPTVLTPATLADPGIGSCGGQYVGQKLVCQSASELGVPCLRGPTTAYGICCPGHYGDDSRADDLSMFVNALLGYPFGDSGDPTYGDYAAQLVPLGRGKGRSLSSGLYCLLGPSPDQVRGTPGPLTSLGLNYSAVPRVFDVHSYPGIVGAGDPSGDPRDCADSTRGTDVL